MLLSAGDVASNLPTVIVVCRDVALQRLRLLGGKFMIHTLEVDEFPATLAASFEQER
jgi:hypothetical protein